MPPNLDLQLAQDITLLPGSLARSVSFRHGINSANASSLPILRLNTHVSEPPQHAQQTSYYDPFPFRVC
jgi:hypothetical protein